MENGKRALGYGDRRTGVCGRKTRLRLVFFPYSKAQAQRSALVHTTKNRRSYNPLYRLPLLFLNYDATYIAFFISCRYPCIHSGVRPAWLQIPSLQLTFNFPVLWLTYSR